VTVTDRSPGAALADPGLVVTTAELDQGWCHTIGYLSPILAGASVGARIAGAPVDGEAVAALLEAGLVAAPAAEAMAAGLTDVDHLVVVASGIDRPAGRELVLKVEEATWIPSAFRELETMLHGHLPATDERTGLILVLTDPARRPERVARARQLLEAAHAVGIRAGAIVAAGIDAGLDPSLTPVGRIVAPEPPGLDGTLAAVVGAVVPLQLLTERLARARGTDPDPIRRDDPRYLAAAEVAEG
jgi:glucosamine--fructose-6-phosphate aminotransferase (isomerizing)